MTRLSAGTLFALAAVSGLMGAVLTVMHGRIVEDAGTCWNTLPLGLPLLALGLLSAFLSVRAWQQRKLELVVVSALPLVAEGVYLWLIAAEHIGWYAVDCA